MKWGNCLLYALWRLITTGGRVELGRTYIRLALPRFWHIGKDGTKTRFAPLKPRKGWTALPHKIWFRGQVKHDNRAN